MNSTTQKICVIITGGTVLKGGDGHFVGIKQESDIANWVAAVPELGLFGSLVTFMFFYGGREADVTPRLWLKTARFIYEHQREYRGFIILASIDNIPYFSNALALLLE